MPNSSSRARFDEYRQEVRRRKKTPRDAARHALASKRGEVHERNRTFFELFRTFWSMLRGHRRTVVAALATLTLATLLRLAPPLATKLAIDSVLSPTPLPLPAPLSRLPLPSSPMGLLLAIALTVTLVTGLATAIHLWGRWLATKTVNRVQVSIRRRVFEHTIRLPLHRVHALKSGGVASLIREDAGGVAELIFSMLYNPWQAIIQFVGSLLILAIVDWKLMLGGMLLLPAVFVTHRTWISRIRPLYRDIRRQRQSIDGSATETFGGIRIVRTFARAHSESSRFVRENDYMVRQQLFTWWWTRVVEVIWEVLIPLASTALLLYGGRQILQGELTLGELMMFLVYLTMLLGPVATLAGSAVGFQTNLAGLDRILDVLEHEEELPSNPGAVSVSAAEVAGAIRLEGVCFRYPESEPMVLQDIDLSVAPGETVALVGRSGAGKTTLTNLIARFYDPSAGRVMIDGRNLRDVDLESYRRLLGIVEQDVFLFDGSIRDNIAYARRRASDVEVVEAAEAAAAAEFIDRLPDGYETLIGERGIKLSGGQRQRIAIARAILADPKILILDEATSNLDSESERLIQRSLRTLLRNRTSFVIAHRLSTITHADKIVVMEAGRIVQVGTHAELAGRSGRYRDMVYLQMQPAELAAASAEP